MLNREVESKIREYGASLEQKLNKGEVTNGMTPKGNLLFANLPTSGNNIGDYYYCSDGDGINPSGNYAWNGTSWYFAGTGDEGYSDLRKVIGVDGNTSYVNNVSVYRYGDSITEGKVIHNGTEITVTGWGVTGYIECQTNDIVDGYFGNASNLTALTLYDKDKKYLTSLFSSTAGSFSLTITTPNVAYLKYNVRLDSTTFPKESQYLKIKRSVNSIEKKINNINNDVNSIKNSNRYVYYVGANRIGSNAFQTLKACCEYIKTNNIYNSIVYVDAGKYDLVAEFTQAYLDSIQATTNKGFGLMIGNNTHFIFDEGANVEFNYNGNNNPTTTYFSAFNVYGSCILENAKIDVWNCRYCVHEDLPSVIDVDVTPLPNSYTAKYINCIMEHHGNTKGTYTGTICIGGGTNKNSLSIVDGGRYKCSNQFPYAISYHNAYTSSPSTLMFKNVWVNNAIRLADFGTGNYVDTTITGCYLPNGHTIGNYFNITEWGNTNV